MSERPVAEVLGSTILYTKIMTELLLWPMHKSLRLEPVTWISDSSRYLNGLRVERDLVILQRIHTSVNEADHLTKVLDRTLFYRHVDHLMVPPLYSPCYGKVTGKEQIVIREDVIEEHFAKPRMLMPVAAKSSVDSYTWEYIVASTTIFQSTSDFFHSEFNQYWIVGGC
jgi:hypothetical protein